MCYTSSTSIKAFIIGVISSLLLVYSSNNNDYKIIGYFFLFVSCMQLFDALFWNYPPPLETNKIATKFAILFNHLQPIVLFLLINHYNKGQIHTGSKLLTLFYTIIITIYTISLWNKVNYTTVTDRSSPSLDWEWNRQKFSSFVYFIGLFIGLSIFTVFCFFMYGGIKPSE